MGTYVLGMHRSGTSVLARMVGLLVAYDGHRGAEADNLEGHWEIPRMNVALEAALKAVDADWVGPPLTPLDATDPRIAGPMAQVADVVAGLGHEEWVLKDPRLCLGLTATLSIPQPPARLVCTFREPSEVARSIASRGGSGHGFEPEYGLAVWEVYNRLLLEQVRASARPTTWVSYDDLMGEPRATASRLGDFLAQDGAHVGEGAVARAATAVNPSLRHHDTTDAGLSDEQRALLSLLRECARDGSTVSGDVPPLTGWARALLEVRRPFIRMEQDNRYLAHRLRRLGPAFRVVDGARRRLGRPAPDVDPLERYR